MPQLVDYYNTGQSAQGTVWSQVAGDFKKQNAQYFTASQNYSITSMKFLAYREGSPGTVYMDLHAVDGSNKPTGASLAAATMNGNTITTTTTGGGEWYEMTFSTPYSIISGTKYALVMRVTGADPAAVFWAMDDTSPTYSGGNQWASSDSGSTWSQSSGDCDLMFETYGIITNIKSINGLAYASVKSVNGLATSSVKSFNGLA